MRARLIASVLAAVFSAAVALGAVDQLAGDVSKAVEADSGWNAVGPESVVLADSGWNPLGSDVAA